MSTAKIVEIISQGASIDEAVKNGVKDVAKSVTGIQAVYVKEIQALVNKQQVTTFRTTLKITFIVEEI